MKKPFLFLLSVLISAYFCEKLSKGEDEQRARTCGRVQCDSLDNPMYHAPWIHQIVDPNRGTRTAFLISPRHFIVASTWFLKKANDKWKYMNDNDVNINECKYNILKIPETQFSNSKIHLDCRGEECDHVGGLNITSVHYIGSCEKDHLVGLALVEIGVNVTVGDGRHLVRPICLPGGKTNVTDGDVLEEQSTLGNDKLNVKISGNRTIKRCRKPHKEHYMCVKNSSGLYSGWVKKTDGVDTLLGITVEPKRNVNRPEAIISLIKLEDRICRLTEICGETVYGPREDPNEELADGMDITTTVRKSSSKKDGIVELLALSLFFGLGQ